MADKTNYLVSHFFVSSDYFLQFESLRDFAFRGGCCSTVLAKVNCKNQHLKFEYCLESLTEMSGFFLMSKTHCFLSNETKMQARSLLSLPPHIKALSHPNSATSVFAERLI